LNKTNELSQQQIKDLEASVEHFNCEIKHIKENYEEQLFDLRKQMESIDAQLRAEKSFSDVRAINRVTIWIKINKFFFYIKRDN